MARGNKRPLVPVWHAFKRVIVDFLQIRADQDCWTGNDVDEIQGGIASEVTIGEYDWLRRRRSAG